MTFKSTLEPRHLSAFVKKREAGQTSIEELEFDHVRSKPPSPFASILVIDDSQTVIRAVQGAFQPPAYTVDSVEHVLEIPRYVRRTPPDLIILDLNMPVLSGQRVSDFIRRIQRHEIPILIYSSLPEADLCAAAAQTGAAGWISKQAPLSKLVIRAKRIITRQRRGSAP